LSNFWADSGRKLYFSPIFSFSHREGGNNDDLAMASAVRTLLLIWRAGVKARLFFISLPAFQGIFPYPILIL